MEEIKSGNDLMLIEKEELKISLTVSDNKKNKSKNITSINLGECENKLKDSYGIPENEILLILKIEVKKKNMKIPRIEYEVYYPSNGTTLYKLDMNKCHNLNIEIYVPLIIDDEGVDKRNASSGYYNDICYTCKAVNNSDITLKDRKEEYFYNDMGACEEICNFIDYDYEYNKATCSCKVKEEVKKYSEININKTLLFSKFKDIKNILNLNTMKCYKKLFSKNGILYNIGFYITILTIMLHFAISIIFYLIDFALINTIINKIKCNLNLNNEEKNKDEGENKNNDSDKK